MSRACHTESVPQIRGGRSYPTPEVLVSRWCQGLVAKHSHMCFQLCHLQIISFARYTLRKQEIYFSLLKIGKEISFFSLRTFTLENLQELSHLFKMPVFEDQRGLFFSWHFFFFFFPVLGLRDVFLRTQDQSPQTADIREIAHLSVLVGGQESHLGGHCAPLKKSFLLQR